MINLWYEESYWAHTGGKLSGPEMVVKNLIKSLDLMGIAYATNENVYQKNLFLQWTNKATIEHSHVNWDDVYVGPQLWPFDSFGSRNPVGSNFLTSAANRQACDEASKRLMAATPLRPQVSPSKYSFTELPIGVIAPRPVTTTR